MNARLYPLVFALALLFCLTIGTRAAEPQATDKPNIILIFADDLGYGDLSGFGNPEWKTPRLDRMAEEGARLTAFYVPTPYCAPSRATILTGRYPFRHGVVFNPAPDAGINNVFLPDSEITLAELLRPAGYATTCIGKWHLGHTPRHLPTTQGFDEYLGILYSNDMRPVQLVENGRVAQYPVPQSTLTRRYTDRAIEFIEANRDRPFFLYLPHAMPHKPLAASDDFYTPETPGDLYGDVIRELDHSVGRVLDTLEELGLEENTLVIFTSDNGPWYGGSTGGLRGMKGKTWEGGLRVPFIARWADRIPQGLSSNQIAGTIDLLPTLCRLTGVQPPDDRAIDGKNIWPLLTEENAESPHDAVFGMSGPNLAVMRSGKWKLHMRSPGPPRFHNRSPDDWTDPRGPDGVTILAPHEQARPDQHPGLITGDGPERVMLFDLENDLAEQHNVADQYPEILQRLTERFEQTNAEVPDFTRPERDSLFQEPERGRPPLMRLKGGELRYDRIPEPQQHLLK